MNTSLKTAIVGIALLCAVVFIRHAPAQPENREVDGEADLKDRVAKLEKTVAEMRQSIQDDKLVSSLRGKWMEKSWIRAGKHIDESEFVFGGGGGGGGGDVAWLLATDTSSRRIVLSPEPETTFYGKFSVDTSNDPAWIDFQVRARDGKLYPLRGIVKYTYQRAEIAIPTKVFESERFLDPPRPTDFTSTEENGYSVHSLIRESYQRTGVW